MRNPLRLLALAVATFAFAACGSDSNAPDTSHVGRYALLSIDGDPLPITVDDGTTTTLTLQSGSLTLNAGGTFVQTLDIDVEINGQIAPTQHLSCNGNYTRRGNTINLTAAAGGMCEAGTLTGTLSGNTLTVDDQGSVAVFQR